MKSGGEAFLLNRVVVLGAKGLLGRYLVDEMRRKNIEVSAYGHDTVNIVDEKALEMAVSGASVVYNAAAYTDVDGAEHNPDLAYAVNAWGVHKLARACARIGAVLVHFSTEFVFGKGYAGIAYDESIIPNPLSVYGRTKFAGEKLAMETNPKSHVIRVQSLYGKDGKNFASKIYDAFRSKRKDLSVDNERKIQPTYARVAARAAFQIAQSDRYGVWHASCRGETTWHEFSKRFADRLGLPFLWRPVPTAVLKLSAPRPPVSLLDNRRMSLYGFPSLPLWQDAQDEYLAEMAGS